MIEEMHFVNRKSQAVSMILNGPNFYFSGKIKQKNPHTMYVFQYQ